MEPRAGETKETMQALVIVCLLVTLVRAAKIHWTKEVELPEKAKLKSIQNTFTYAGILFPAADVLELNLRWSVNGTRSAQFAAEVHDNVDLIEQRFVGAPDELRALLKERLGYLEERVNASVLQEQDAMREIAKAASYSEAMGDGLREIRSIFSNIFMLLMGVESSALSSRVDRVADGLAQTSKEVLVNRDHIKELANLTQKMAYDFTTSLRAEQVTDGLAHIANKVIYEHRQAILFYRAIARGELKLEILPSTQYDYIMAHLDKVTREAGVKTVKRDLVNAPHTARLEGDDLRISIYVAVYPRNVLPLDSYHPLPGIFSYENRLFQTGKPQEALVAVSQDGTLNMDLTLEEYGGCHREQALIVCFGQRVLSKVVKSCSMARFKKDLEATIEHCDLHPMPKEAAFWMHDSKSLEFVSQRHEAPQVNKTCGNKTTSYHQEHLALETGCVYETKDLLVYGRSRLSADLHLEAPFQFQFKPHDLPPFHQERLRMLEFDDFRGYDKHDFDGYDLFHHVGVIVLLVAVGLLVVVAVAGLGYCLWTRKTRMARLLEDLVDDVGGAEGRPQDEVAGAHPPEAGGRAGTATPPQSRASTARYQRTSGRSFRLLLVPGPKEGHQPLLDNDSADDIVGPPPEELEAEAGAQDRPPEAQL